MFIGSLPWPVNRHITAAEQVLGFWVKCGEGDLWLRNAPGVTRVFRYGKYRFQSCLWGENCWCFCLQSVTGCITSAECRWNRSDLIVPPEYESPHAIWKQFFQMNGSVLLCHLFGDDYLIFKAYLWVKMDAVPSSGFLLQLQIFISSDFACSFFLFSDSKFECRNVLNFVLQPWKLTESV